MLFSSQSLVVLLFTFGAAIHLELGFVYKMRWESTFTFPICFSDWPSTIYYKDHALSTTLQWPFYHKPADHVHVGLFLQFLFCYTGLLSILQPMPQCLRSLPIYNKEVLLSSSVSCLALLSSRLGGRAQWKWHFEMVGEVVMISSIGSHLVLVGIIVIMVQELVLSA